ncbi:MAG: sulfotransferase family 2 domain-containing protein [Brevirhabdus sp.]
MLVFWNENLVYLAVPKTGSTALETALDPHANIAFRSPANVKHSHAYRFNKYTRPLLDRSARKNWELVAIVREPVSWLGSWFRYRQRSGTHHLPESTRGLSFEQFIQDHLEPEPPTASDVGRQSFMVMSDDGQLLVDHLFVYEQMDKAILFFEDRLRRKLSVPRRNVSPDATLELSDGLASRLRAEKAREFELYQIALDRQS